MISLDRVTEAIRNHPLIEIVNEEVTEIPEGITIIATGPLTSPALAENSKRNDWSRLFVFL